MLVESLRILSMLTSRSLQYFFSWLPSGCTMGAYDHIAPEMGQKHSPFEVLRMIMGLDLQGDLSVMRSFSLSLCWKVFHLDFIAC